MRTANARWPLKTDLNALESLYCFMIRQMYRFKHEGKPYDHIARDVNIILDRCNSIIENEVIRKIDDGGNGVFTFRQIRNTTLRLQSEVPQSRREVGSQSKVEST
jgi:hypothetical protein